jgi:hypothetical protein
MFELSSCAEAKTLWVCVSLRGYNLSQGVSVMRKLQKLRFRLARYIEPAIEAEALEARDDLCDLQPFLWTQQPIAPKSYLRNEPIRLSMR